MNGKSFFDSHGRDLYEDTRELSLQLAAHMILQSGIVASLDKAYDMATNALRSGAALQKFKELCGIHSGKLEALPSPALQVKVIAQNSGFISSMNTELIGLAGIVLGAGRQQTSDLILPTSGIEFHHKIGDFVNAGDTLFTLHGEHPLTEQDQEGLSRFQRAETMLRSVCEFSSQTPTRDLLIAEVLT